jgi:predicted ATPase
VGRQRELPSLEHLLGDSRLVTLTGVGGCGKTRLGLQVGSQLLDGYPDGVRLAELSSLPDPELVITAVAAVLGVREQHRWLVEALVEYLQAKHVLLILDDCEHVVETPAWLSERLLQSCARLQILATSREPLGVLGEVVLLVPPLDVPEGGASVLTSDARAADAVRLFLERAQAGAPGMMLDAACVPVVVNVCRQLDGLPLAIELAAARVRALGLDELAARLDDRFRLLTGGSRTAMPRQQTLRGAVDWSYALLSEPEQCLFERLAVSAAASPCAPPKQSVGARILTRATSRRCWPAWWIAHWSYRRRTLEAGSVSDSWKACASTARSAWSLPEQPAT